MIEEGKSRWPSLSCGINSKMKGQCVSCYVFGEHHGWGG